MAAWAQNRYNPAPAREANMNRKKKIFTKLSQKAKKANLKANPKGKPKYISKADREKLALEAEQAAEPDNQTTP